MRYYFAIALLLFTIGGSSTRAQNPFEPDTYISCVERIQPPAYPLLAIQSRSEGTVAASVVVSPRGLLEELRTDFTSKTPKVTGALIQAVEASVRGATYRYSCGGKTVTLLFDFKIDGTPSENPKQTVAFGYPNKFWIVTEPGKTAAVGKKK